MADSEFTLKEFIDFRFKKLEEKVDSLEKKVDTLEDCLSNDVKHAIKMWKWIGGLVAAIVTALTIAWLRQVLGL